MVQGRVWLFDGGTIRIQAKDMLSALKEATDSYGSRIKRMTMKTVEEGEKDGGGEVDQAGNRVAG